ncbi:uncharacterized protein LOC134222914 [Armigeres subalbatus]|uniref:uncharacterized protein LOC134222914 n=1 Tax=Armigeres subalbatus TaxID=124917 RepID=UPI002ED58912
MASDLSTAGFLSVLRRFIGYRGIPSEIHSDNATNFSGANNEIKALHELLKNQLSLSVIRNELAQQGIAWMFIPPRAPNFGGLWEAAVKSVKTALKKEIGLQQLSHDEFITLLVQISAILNSRPLSPLSDDPTEFEALTPAHFLIGSTMKALPEPNLLEIPTNRLDHYQRIQQMFQRYWQRWSKQYLTQLQMTSKNSPIDPLRIGSIVVLREDNLPPLCWPLARIICLHPGTDGIVRVVTVKTLADRRY